jgi:hypothetical protein
LTAVTVARVGDDDLTDLLPLLRAYCDFYRVAPSDDDLVARLADRTGEPSRHKLYTSGSERPRELWVDYWIAIDPARQLSP